MSDVGPSRVARPKPVTAADAASQLRPAPPSPVGRGLIVDLFAGGGGASTGILMATGLHPDIAVNHDPQAVALHAMNHPTTRHYCCDVFEIDPVAACSDTHGQLLPVDLLWASPDCTHHSKARGGKPADKNIRALAWVVVKWASKVRPAEIYLENVEEFQDWGPLDADNRPDNTLFDRGLKPWRAAAEIIDWDQPCPSIFGRKKPRAPKTQKRIAKGIKKFVIDTASPFIVPVTHHGERQNHDLAEPFKTITAANRGELALVAPTLMPRYGERDGQAPRSLDITRPYPTVVPGGNGGDLSASFLSRVDMSSADRAGLRAASSPLATVVAAGGIASVNVSLAAPPPQAAAGQTSVLSCPMVAPVLIGASYGDDRPGAGLRAWSVQDPVRTITSSGAGGFAVLAAHVTKFRAESAGAGADMPLPTVTANSYVKRPGGAVPLGLIAAHLGRQFGTAVGRDLGEPHPTVMTDGAGGKSYIAAAHLTSYYGNGDGSPADGPMPTVVTKDRHAPVAAFLEQANTGVIGHSAEAPVSTILSAGCHQRPVMVSLSGIEGEPGSRRATVVAFLRAHFGEPTDAEIADPLSTALARLRFGLVLIPVEGGEPEVWQITDIGLRMLTPRELYGAQGFPADYVIDHTADGPLTKTAQTRMAGNSVSPPPAAALIAANSRLARHGQRPATMREARG